MASFYSGGGVACDGLGGVPPSTTAEGLGVANRTMPCGTWITVCSARCARVQVIDRGPFITGRDFDLTEATAIAIGFPMGAGVASVRVRVG